MARGAVRNIVGDHFLRRLAEMLRRSRAGPAEPAPVTQGSGGRNRTGDGKAAARWIPPEKGGTAGHHMSARGGGHRGICGPASTSLRRFCPLSRECRVFRRGIEFHRDNYSVVIHKGSASRMSDSGDVAGPGVGGRDVRYARKGCRCDAGLPERFSEECVTALSRNGHVAIKCRLEGGVRSGIPPAGDAARPICASIGRRERGVARSVDLATPLRVGVTGFEPATLPSRTARATKLRHTPVDHAGAGHRGETLAGSEELSRPRTASGRAT